MPSREVEIIESIQDRIEAVGFEALTPEERYYFAIWWLESEANNGAFHQFFSNPARELSHDAATGLRAVGASRMAELLESAITLFPDATVPRKREERKRILEGFSDAQSAELDRLSNAFTDYPDHLRTLLEQYVRRNDEQFRGPHSVRELWEARRARGAQTQPRRVNPIDLEKTAAEDAKMESSRPCPQCGQPTPGYRKTCKRCGFPIGRAV